MSAVIKELSAALPSRQTYVGDLAELWYAGVTESPGTKDSYRGLLDGNILPRLGENRLREVITGRVKRFISEVAQQRIETLTAKNGSQMMGTGGVPTAANMSRTVLAMIFGLAVRYDAVDFKPVRESQRAAVLRTAIRALTVE